MHITVFGANGRVGSKVVTGLLDDGHSVAAFIHGASKLKDNKNLKIIQGDIHSLNDVAVALKNSDAVVSALGSWGTKSKDILSTGMRTIVPEMEAAGIKRIISLTGAGAAHATDNPRLIDRINHSILRLFAPKILRDGEEHIKTLHASSLDWTVVRSPIMVEGSNRGFLISKVAPMPWSTIDREDVVEAIIQFVSNTQHVRSAPYIVRR